MNQKKTKRETASLCPQSSFMFTWWGQAMWAVKP